MDVFLVDYVCRASVKIKSSRFIVYQVTCFIARLSLHWKFMNYYQGTILVLHGLNLRLNLDVTSA